MVSTVSASDAVARWRDATPLVSHEGDRTVVWLAGEHDIATVLDLTDTLTRSWAIDNADLVVDLSLVTFLSAATIDVLVRGRAYLRGRSRTLSLRSPSRAASRVLELCGLSALVESG